MKPILTLLFGAAVLNFLNAQTLDTGILGLITAPSGAVIAGASVTVTNTATGVKRLAATGPDGKYEIRYLVPGQYTVEVTSAGFRPPSRRSPRKSSAESAPVQTGPPSPSVANPAAFSRAISGS